MTTFLINENGTPDPDIEFEEWGAAVRYLDGLQQEADIDAGWLAWDRPSPGTLVTEKVTYQIVTA